MRYSVISEKGEKNFSAYLPYAMISGSLNGDFGQAAGEDVFPVSAAFFRTRHIVSRYPSSD